MRGRVRSPEFRHTTFCSGHHQVLDSDVRERAARHHQIIPAPAAVAVEISRLNPARHQIFPGWRSFFDCSRRRNVVGRYRVAENPKRAGAADLLDMPGLHGEILEKWRLVDVIAFFIPLINVARARWNFVPLRILTGKIAIELTESFRGERGLHDVPDFAESRPEIAKKRFVAVLVF